MQRLKEAAAVADAWRVVPRLMVLAYGYICFDAYQWIVALDAPTTQQISFASTIWGAAAAWFGFYVNSGPKRD